MTEAPVVVMMGADDLMLPDYADVVLKSFTDFPQAEVVQPGVRVIDGRGQPGRILADSVKSLAMPRPAIPELLQSENTLRLRAEPSCSLPRWSSTTAGTGDPIPQSAPWMAVGSMRSAPSSTDRPGVSSIAAGNMPRLPPDCIGHPT